MAASTKVNDLQVQTIIENYEQLIRELNNELSEVKDDHEAVKTQLSSVLKENKALSETVKNLSNEKTNKQTAFSFNQQNNDEIVENLQQQVNTVLTEKQCVTELWQNCVKTIEYLDAELKVFQSGTQEYVPKREVQKLKLAYEEKIGLLELQLSSTKHKLEETVKHASSELEIKHSAIDQSLETQAGAFKIIKNLEAEVLKLQNRLKETNEDNIYLEKTIQSKDDVIQGLRRRNFECTSKVTEAISLVEAALNEKDAALFREKEILANNENLLEKLSQTTKDSEEKIKTEIMIIKNEHCEKMKTVLDDLKNTQAEVNNKSLQTEELIKKIANLEKELQRIEAGDPSISKLLVLEKNLESTFQKLLLSEKQNIQLTSERDSIKNDMEQITNLYERNLKAKEIEIATLNNKIKQLNGEINESRLELNVVNEKIVKLNETITNVENEFKTEKQKYESKINEKYTAKIEDLTNSYNGNIKNLQSQIESKDENNKKWRTETKEIINNLEKIVTHLRAEHHKLKKENSKLRVKLGQAEEKINQYKLFLELISSDVNKISSLAVGDHATSR